MERVVTDEFKAQSTDANNNTFLAVYGLILGIIFLHISEVSTAFSIIYKTPARPLAIMCGIMFFPGLLAGSMCFLIQCVWVKFPDIDAFAPNMEVCKYAFKEKKKILDRKIAHTQEHLDQIDSLLSDVVTLLLVTEFNVVIKRLRYYNKEKRKLQFMDRAVSISNSFCWRVGYFLDNKSAYGRLNDIFTSSETSYVNLNTSTKSSRYHYLQLLHTLHLAHANCSSSHY